MAIQPLQFHGDVEQAVNASLLPHHLLDARFGLQGLGQGGGIGRIVRHHLAQPVDQAEGHLQHAANITKGGAGLQLTEGNDLRHLVVAVFLLHVADHLVPLVLAEVNIEVGHGDPLRVQEPFKQQSEPQWVQIGDLQGPGNDGARARTAAWSYRNCLCFGPLDEIGDDQEIAGKAHVDDDIQFEGQTSPIWLRLFGIHRDINGSHALCQARFGHGAHSGLFIAAVAKAR